MGTSPNFLLNAPVLGRIRLWWRQRQCRREGHIKSEGWRLTGGGFIDGVTCLRCYAWLKDLPGKPYGYEVFAGRLIQRASRPTRRKGE